MNDYLEKIEEQINILSFKNNFTTIHKISCLEAFRNLLNRYPEKFLAYLNNSRSGGFQSKIFQEYISILEKKLPIDYTKNKKYFVANSITDFDLFDGVSVFDAVVSEKLTIKNNTKEFYIGGRNGAISAPYYIGKLLNVISTHSILDKVESYSFSQIKLKDVLPNTNVKVMHLRIPPHYQMGGMVYVNNVRKLIK